jgi:hypothetical protein
VPGGFLIVVDEHERSTWGDGPGQRRDRGIVALMVEHRTVGGHEVVGAGSARHLE